MRKFLIITGLLSVLAPALSTPSHAVARNFFTPTVGGDRLSFCATTGADCGKPIADAWCQAVGFEQALNYQRDHASLSRVSVARYADTGGICTGVDCLSFSQIKCWRAS